VQYSRSRPGDCSAHIQRNDIERHDRRRFPHTGDNGYTRTDFVRARAQ